MFAAIGAQVLRHLDVPRSDAGPVQIVAAPSSAPAPGERALPAGDAPVVVTAADETPDGAMPGLAGKTLRQALVALSALPVEVEIAGRGVVVRQSPAAGEPIAAGAVARLELAPR